MQLITRVLLRLRVWRSAHQLFAQPQTRTSAKPGPWFGVPLPPPLGKEPAVIVGDRAPRPVVLPSGETPSRRTDRHDDQGRRRGHRQHREREPDHARDRQRPVVGPHHRPAIGHESGDVVGRSVPQGGHRGREGPADCDGAERAVLVPAVVGSPAARRSGVRSGNGRRRPGFGDAAGAVGYSRRDDDGAARLRRLGQSVDPSARRREGKDRGPADDSAGTHGVRARAGWLTRRRSGGPRRGRRVQPGPASGQRAIARLQRLRESMLQHRRP